MSEFNLSMTAYCGLNCDDCFSYKKTVSEAAKNLRREMRSAKMKEFWKEIPFLDEYEPFKRTLDGLARLRCIKGCRDGGGNPWCKFRKCAQKRKIDGCWQCTDFETCGNLVERHIKNIKILKKALAK